MIDMLPDDVLLEIFDFYRMDPEVGFFCCSIYLWRWQGLIQVCRRWRYVVFGSPLRLDLRVICTDRTSTRASLDIWPSFPINITCHSYRVDDKSVENIIAAVEHGHDRISHFSIEFITGSASGKLTAAMQQPLPTLKHFRLMLDYESVPAPVVSKTFLGGSAPLLEVFTSRGLPFPTFPEFISSSAHIRDLRIHDIPHSGYISPNAMVACLAVLPNLEVLSIGILSRPSHCRQVKPPPCAHMLLPALVRFSFHGFSDYFEHFVAQIDTPLLNNLHITFITNGISPQLQHFIGRAERLKSFDQARIVFYDREVYIGFGQFYLRIISETQLSSMVQICGQQMPLLSHIEELKIEGLPSKIEWIDDPHIYSSQWLELFHPFIALQRLYISDELVTFVTAALQELTERRTMEVLPAMQSLVLEGLEPSGPVPEGIESFVGARRLSGHHVAVQSWDPNDISTR
jgi:hypothetical protein